MNGDRQACTKSEAVYYTGTIETAPQSPENASFEAGYGSFHYSYRPNINMLAQSFIPLYSGNYPSLDDDTLKGIYDSIQGERDHILKVWNELKHGPNVQKLVADYFSYPPKVVQWVHDFNCDCADAQKYRKDVQKYREAAQKYLDDTWWEMTRMRPRPLPQHPTSSASSDQILNYSDSKRPHGKSHGSSHGNSRR